MIARRIAEITTELAQSETQTNRDPLVQLKQRELDLRAMEVQRKTMQDMDSNEIRENEIEENLEIQKMKLENQEDQAVERIKVAREKIQLQRKKMSLTKKGKKIKKSFKKQYGKDADKVFYASANKGTLKGVIKKLRRGSTGFEGSPELGGQGTRTSTTYGGGERRKWVKHTTKNVKLNQQMAGLLPEMF